MGWLDWLPCCGARSQVDDDDKDSGENERLVPPERPTSIISVEPSYGAIENGTNGETLTKEQRKRIEDIGREAGSQMLSIHRSSPRPPQQPSRRSTSSQTRSSSGQYQPTNGIPRTGTITPPSESAGPSSVASSRPSSPSPLRPDTSPPGGVMTVSDGGEGDGEGEGKVIRKQVFMGGMGSTRGRGRGRGKSKGKR